MNVAIDCFDSPSRVERLGSREELSWLPILNKLPQAIPDYGCLKSGLGTGPLDKGKETAYHVPDVDNSGGERPAICSLLYQGFDQNLHSNFSIPPVVDGNGRKIAMDR